MKILVVDGYVPIRRITKKLLAQIGFNDVEEAENGAAALQKLREKSFGLVICDLNMEPMNGLQVLKEIRADEQLTKMPFIMAMAENKTESIFAIKQAGANNHIAKPFNADMLKQKIQSVLGTF